MHFIRKIAAFLLVLSIVLGAAPLSLGAEPNHPPLFLTETHINPLYQDILTEADLLSPSPFAIATAEEPVYTASIPEAAAVLRGAMKERQETITVYFYTDGYDQNEDAVRSLIRQIAQEALVHTGDPTEGDYLMWQFGGWKSSASGSVADGRYYWTITYTYTYYTTAEEEAMVAEKAASILSQLDTEGASDYQKIRFIYDYICKNVSYDYAHKNDPSYKYQFTAYAALIDGTSVCQGYALAFYRLALSLGLDCRLIPGTSRNESHGWNIVKLHNQYYNLDCTWDSGDVNYRYFLKSSLNFRDHTRQTEYDTQSFHLSYPMALLDYEPTAADLCSHVYEQRIILPDCTQNGYTLHSCSLCGYSYTTEETEMLGHSWDEEYRYQPPTETADGWMEYHCRNCSATKTETIPALDNVYRVYGDNRYETAFQAAELLKKQLLVDKFNCIIVASGTGFADALSGSYLAAQKRAPILLVNQHTVKAVADYIIQNSNPMATVYILGGEAAVPGELDALLTNTFQVKRLSGANRYETNLLILEEAEVHAEDVLVCTGRDFADSLSVYALGLPILLVNKTLTEGQKAWLSTLKQNDLYVIGGTNAVSEDIERALTNYSKVKRISGSNRYETSVNVAETFFPTEVENLVLAYGHNFPDGLCGGVLANSLNAPLILTREKNMTYAQVFADDRSVHTGAVLGGPGLISDEVLTSILQISKDQIILVQ